MSAETSIDLVSAKELTAWLGCKRDWLYKAMARPDRPFPRPVQLGGNFVRWRRTEVLAWLDAAPRGGTGSRADRSAA